MTGLPSLGHSASSPAFAIVGLPDAAVREAKERVRWAGRTPSARGCGLMRRLHAPPFVAVIPPGSHLDLSHLITP